MSIKDESATPDTLFHLELMDPDMGLYYNPQTHKFEYCNHHCTENSAARAGSYSERDLELPCSPSIKADLRDVYGEIVLRKQKSVCKSDSNDVNSHTKYDGTDTSLVMQTEGRTDKTDADHSRKDSGKELLGVLRVDNSTYSAHPLESSNTPATNASIEPSTTADQHLPATFQQISTLQLSAQTQSKITCITPLLSIQGPSNPHLTCIRRVILTHNIIESADNEEIAMPRKATTIFNAHQDGSVSIFCSLTLSPATACVCAVEKSLESLLKGGRGLPEPEHVSAKREMWRKISVSPRETRNAGVRGPSPLRVSKSGSRLSRKAPVISLVKSFVQLLRPKLGSPKAKEDTIYGLQMFERPICADEAVDLAGETCCGKAMFHISGEVEGAPVDISGFAVRYN